MYTYHYTLLQILLTAPEICHTTGLIDDSPERRTEKMHTSHVNGAMGGEGISGGYWGTGTLSVEAHQL